MNNRSNDNLIFLKGSYFENRQAPEIVPLNPLTQ